MIQVFTFLLLTISPSWYFYNYRFALFPDIDAPIQKEAGNNDVDPSKIAMLVSFGFEEEVAKKALKASVNIRHI